MAEEPIAPRVDKLEEHVDALDNRVDGVEVRVRDNEGAIGRIQSHIESEVGHTRNDISRIEKRLFGDEDDEYGGRFGQMAKRFHRMEVWFLAIIAAAGILLFLASMYQVTKVGK